jgi:hypothetical protein
MINVGDRTLGNVSDFYRNFYRTGRNARRMIVTR